MDRTIMQRGLMAALGAGAGLCFYLLIEILARHLIPDRLSLGLATFGLVFFFGLLAMTGPLSVARAAVGAAGVAIVVAALVVMSSFRFERIEGLFQSPVQVLSAALLATIPLPFWIAFSGPGWRIYPVLFSQSWTIIVRYAAAGLFVTVVWGVIFLSNALFSIVGLTVIEEILELDPVPWVITGLVLGLAMAVVTEFSDLVSPYLVLRLMRLLLPFVLFVMIVFLLALPMRGLSGLLGELSVATTLLAMAGAAATLVTTAVDQNNDEAIQGAWMERSAQALAVLVLVFAVLAGWAVWLRVSEYGWTPARLFAALVSALSLGYGVVYIWAVLGRGRWMRRVRQGNIMMSLILMGAAAAWLSVLNPQSISARDQLKRFEAGRTDLADLDTGAMKNWGFAGRAALARLEDISKAPGQEALAQHLKRAIVTAPDDRRAALVAALAVRPEAADAMRTEVVMALGDWQLEQALSQCQSDWAPGVPGCVLIVGDFWPDTDGAEAIWLYKEGLDGTLNARGFAAINGGLTQRSVSFSDQTRPSGDEAIELVRTALTNPPELVTPRTKSLRLGRTDLGIQP